MSTSTPISLIAFLALVSLVSACANPNMPEPQVHQETTPTEEPTTPMDNERIEHILGELATDLRSDPAQPGYWEFTFLGVPMACITDSSWDRMRIIAPIIQASQLKPEHVQAMLEANFHTALDARYATSQGVVFATFIHPLSPLSDTELRSAVSQVAHLVLTFGTDYSSGGLGFGGQGNTPPQKTTEPPDSI